MGHLLVTRAAIAVALIMSSPAPAQQLLRPYDQKVNACLVVLALPGSIDPGRPGWKRPQRHGLNAPGYPRPMRVPRLAGYRDDLHAQSGLPREGRGVGRGKWRCTSPGHCQWLNDVRQRFRARRGPLFGCRRVRSGTLPQKLLVPATK